MKKLFLMTTFLCISFYAQSLVQRLNITGQAASGVYTSPIGSGDLEFHVWITISNAGERPLQFDQIHTFWFSSGGAQPQITQKENEMFIIDPGESDEFHFSTNGYTSQIMRAASSVNEPVKFGFYLTKGNSTISRRYYAVLPELEKLPRHLYHDRKGKQLYKLHFSSID